MLTISTEEVYLFGALRAGADGYLLKDMDLARIPSAIHDAVADKAALPRALTARLIDEFRDTAPCWRSVSEQSGLSRLTSREWEIVVLLRSAAAVRSSEPRTATTSSGGSTTTPATARTRPPSRNESATEQRQKAHGH